jgi:hypothetical protein
MEPLGLASAPDVKPQAMQGRPSLKIDYIVLLFERQHFQRQAFRLTLSGINAIKSYNKSDDYV